MAADRRGGVFTRPPMMQIRRALRIITTPCLLYNEIRRLTPHPPFWHKIYVHIPRFDEPFLGSRWAVSAYIDIARNYRPKTRLFGTATARECLLAALSNRRRVPKLARRSRARAPLSSSPVIARFYPTGDHAGSFPATGFSAPATGKPADGERAAPIDSERAEYLMSTGRMHLARLRRTALIDLAPKAPGISPPQLAAMAQVQNHVAR